MENIMLLKSLELQGFKTFPDKTKLTFNKGMTSIVGPNGSGKSNISDAIRWVLGEQSPKSIRCHKMEDVVFDGTDERKRQGFAEVTLTIDNKDRALPFDGDIVAITRRYYRSGESEYLINKASVRLKDIHELFMDTGLGRDGYSMIGQGKIDAIVSSKSEERREIFEEAAGISRYRYRKNEAEKKLQSTEDNLVRLRDIVKELAERVGPLETQSKKATEFLEYAGEKRGLEIALWLDTLNKSSSTLKEQEDKIDVARAQYMEVEDKINSFNSEYENIYEEKGKLQSDIESIRTDIDNLTGEISERRSTINVTKNDIEHNLENIDRIKTEINNADLFSKDIANEIDEKETRIANLAETIKVNQKDYENTAEKLTQINTDSSRSSEEIQNVSTMISSLTQKQADARVIVSTSATAITELQSRVSSLKDNLNSKKELLKDTILIQDDYKKKVEEIVNTVISLKNSIDGLEIKLKQKTDKRDKAKSDADKLSLDAQEKERRANILQDLARNYEGYYESVKKVMKESKAGSIGGIKGPVSQLISVPEKYNVAIEVALGNKMQNIITNSEDDAKRAMEMLKKTNGGRATFLPITTVKPRTFDVSDLDDYYGYIGVADKLCSCDEKYQNILSSLLGKIVIAEDLQSAIKIAKEHDYKFKVVTLDGQVINAGGSFTGGSLAKNSGLLSRETDIKNLLKEAEELKVKVEEAKRIFKTAEEEFSSVEAELLGTRADLSNSQQDSVRLETELNACTNELNSLNSDIEDLEKEIKESEDKITEASKNQESAQIELSKYTKDIEDKENELSSLSGSQEKLSEERERLSAALQEAKLVIVSFTKDIESLKSEIETAKLSENEKQELIKQYNADIESIENTNKSLENKIVDVENEVKSIQEKIDNNNNVIAEYTSLIEGLDTKQTELRNQEQDIMSQKEILSNEVSRLEERKISLQRDFDNIISKLWEEYELTKREAEEQAIEIEDIPAAKSRLTELKSKIKALGNVNVGAIEEYKEVSARYNELNVQVEDVEKAKKEIENLIKELTKQMQDVFIESFAQINKNFNQIFKELFGGGNASLELTEPEEILTSGIDIIARPPGKLVKSLELLSGGEKAIVAIALYFSIMKVRPAPFCVMDEIEAALDEVNVDRFANFVKRLCDYTQFILITHRRGTMEEADVLYGVTMQDDGVSKILELQSTERVKELGIDVK